MEINLELITPHYLQKNIVTSCLDPSIFFTVAVVGRQFGKTCIAENLAIFWGINNANTKTMWVSPTDAQAQKVQNEIVTAIIHSGAIKSSKKSKGDTEIRFHNGSVILFRSAASEDSLRGESVHYMILDEAAFMKRTTIEAILLPMLNVTGRHCLFITTPKGKNYIFDYFQKGQDRNKNPKWNSLRYSTLDSPLANKDLIDMFRETLPDKLYQQEIEAQFVDSSSVFNNVTSQLNLPELNAPIPGVKYYAGIDVGIVTDATVVAIVNEDGDLVKYYRYMDEEAPEIIAKIRAIDKKWMFENVTIENNNQGIVLYQELRRVMNNITDFNTNAKTKPLIINRLIHLFNIKGINLVNDDYLRTELESFIYKQTSTGHLKFLADYGFHDDVVMALAIAVYAKENRSNNEVQVHKLGKR